MRKMALTVVCGLLIAGSAAQICAASEHHGSKAHRAPATTSGQFLDANDSLAASPHSFCSQELGNPHNKQTDYLGWSAYRQSGAWDSRNDCP